MTVLFYTGTLFSHTADIHLQIFFTAITDHCSKLQCIETVKVQYEQFNSLGLALYCSYQRPML